jgi:hypothetical protein
MPDPRTFAALCTRLNRAPVYVRGLQRRFGLPILDGAVYPVAYEAFLETLIHLRILGIGEDALLRLWTLERKLMQLLHADSTGSPTWFLDACAARGTRNHRLLLSNFDIGAFLPSGTLQLGLNFAQDSAELFSKSEMGEDAIAVLRHYLPLQQEIVAAIQTERPLVRTALRHFAPRR